MLHIKLPLKEHKSFPVTSSSPVADIVVLDGNNQGRDYIIGDVHGSLHELKKLVSQLGKNDRLFIAGDLVDRGLYSYEVIEFIKHVNSQPHGPKIFVTRGNHEESALEYIDALLKFQDAVGDQQRREAFARYTKALRASQRLEQKWLLNLDAVKDRKKLEMMANFFRQCPVITHVKPSVSAPAFNVVHADLPYSYNELREKIAAGDLMMSPRDKTYALWAREDSAYDIPMNRRKDFDITDPVTYCGHNICNDPRLQSFSLVLDAGTFKYRGFIAVNHTDNKAVLVCDERAPIDSAASSGNSVRVTCEKVQVALNLIRRMKECHHYFLQLQAMQFEQSVEQKETEKKETDSAVFAERRQRFADLMKKIMQDFQFADHFDLFCAAFSRRLALVTSTFNHALHGSQYAEIEKERIRLLQGLTDSHIQIADGLLTVFFAASYAIAVADENGNMIDLEELARNSPNSWVFTELQNLMFRSPGLPGMFHPYVTLASSPILLARLLQDVDTLISPQVLVTQYIGVDYLRQVIANASDLLQFYDALPEQDRYRVRIMAEFCKKDFVHEAMMAGDVKTYMRLRNELKLKAFPRDEKEELLSHVAVATNRPEVVKLLLETKGDMTSPSQKTGDTPLIAACKTRNWPIVGLILTRVREIKDPVLKQIVAENRKEIEAVMWQTMKANLLELPESKEGSAELGRLKQVVGGMIDKLAVSPTFLHDSVQSLIFHCNAVIQGTDSLDKKWQELKAYLIETYCAIRLAEKGADSVLANSIKDILRDVFALEMPNVVKTTVSTAAYWDQVDYRSESRRIEQQMKITFRDAEARIALLKKPVERKSEKKSDVNPDKVFYHELLQLALDYYQPKKSVSSRLFGQSSPPLSPEQNEFVKRLLFDNFVIVAPNQSNKGIQDLSRFVKQLGQAKKHDR